MTNLMPNIASVTDMQRRTRQLLMLAKHTGEPVVILKKNKPTAVLADYDYFLGMIDLDRAIVIAEKEKKEGKLKQLASLKNFIGGGKAEKPTEAVEEINSFYKTA